MIFRGDINGLRAIAVIVVVLYHFGVPGFGGGFIGVDIFFVISGFLMTAILLGQDRESTSLGSFYLARARRIVPALIAVSLAALAYGWFVLPPFDYRELAKHVGASMLFVSNHIYLNEASYFDAAAREKWLLHTWSLSVEWQFYLVYPFFLMLWRGLAARSTRLSGLALVVVFTVSLLSSFWLSHANPKIGFFILPSRAWEMLAGAAAFLYGDMLRRRIGTQGLLLLAPLGLVLIALAVTLIDATTPWPGAWALLPVTGTAIVIVAGSAGNRLVAARPLQAIGLWSYSIYLWHWPIVVALDQAGLSGESVPSAASAVLAVLLGAASFRWIEQPCRRLLEGLQPLKAALLTCAMIAATFLPTLAVYAGKGLRDVRFAGSAFFPSARAIEVYPERFRARYNHFYRMGSCFLEPRQGPEAFLAECLPANARWLLWGDSHGAHLWHGLRAELGAPHVAQLTASGCPPLIGIDFRKRPECQRINDYARIVALRLRPDVILLAGAWTAYSEREIREGLQATVTALRKTDTAWHPRIVLVGPVPHWRRSLPSLLVNDLLTGRSEAISTRGLNLVAQERDQVLRLLSTALDVDFFSPLANACNDVGCLRFFGEGGRMVPFAIDDAHLSDAASLYLVRRLLAEQKMVGIHPAAGETGDGRRRENETPY